MHSLAILVATAALSVELGVQATEDGDFEYIIQIEPALLDALASGESIVNEIPDNVRGGGRLRILVGDRPLPPMRALTNSRPPQASTPSRDGSNTGVTPAQPQPAAQPNSAFLAPPLDNAVNRSATGGLSNPANPNSFQPGTFPTNPNNRPPTPTANSFSPPANNTTGDFKPFTPPPLPDPRDLKVLENLGRDAEKDPPFDFPTQLNPAGSQFLPPSGRPTTPNVQQPIPDPDPQSRYQQPAANNSSQFANSGNNASAFRDLREPAIFQPTSFSEEAATELAKVKPGAAGKGVTETASVIAANSDSRPWTPLAITSLLLFASVGLNAYLGWISRVFYSRYRQVARQMRGQRRSGSSRRPADSPLDGESEFE